MENLVHYADQTGSMTLAKNFGGDARGKHVVIEHYRDQSRESLMGFHNVFENAHTFADAKIRILLNSNVVQVNIKLPDEIAQTAKPIGGNSNVS